jgi:8-hydroxy-5-deazaflavin:NADPH oxidoreductase
VFDGRRLAVPICADFAEAKELAGTLIRTIGCRPVDVGPLDRARNLEAMAAIVIALLFGGADSLTVFNLVDAT